MGTLLKAAQHVPSTFSKMAVECTHERTNRATDREACQ